MNNPKLDYMEQQQVNYAIKQKSNEFLKRMVNRYG